MGDMKEFSTGVRLMLKAYPWRRIKDAPWSPLARPLAGSRVALLSSAGFVLRDQPRFDESIRGGDVSFREIPADTPTGDLIDTHRSDSFDHKGMVRDPNVAFPLDRLRELAAAGRVGSLNHRHLSFMGSIMAPGRLIKQTAPEVARGLVEDGVNVALLVPV